MPRSARSRINDPYIGILDPRDNHKKLITSLESWITRVKMHNLLQVVNRREQCCAAPSEQCCQQGCSAMITMLLQHCSTINTEQQRTSFLSILFSPVSTTVNNRC